MEPVRTHRAKSVVEAARLHRARNRRETGLTLVEGSDLLFDVARTGARIVEIFSVEAPVNPLPGATSPTLVDERALQRLSGTKHPRGPVAVVEIPEDRLDPARNVLVSAGVSDPGNVGTMIRTAAAYGWGFAYLSGTADPWSPKTIRAGAGGQFQTPVKQIASLGELDIWTTVAAVVRGGGSVEDITGRPVALLIGEEAHGLADEVVSACEHSFTIDTPGPTESLNAAVAAAIAVHELSKGSGQARADV